MQMKANQQYEQGLSQVKSTYNSIFNQPVTGEEATNRQKEYTRAAQEQMKSISASDLSDPKNVLAAENIMRPFHDDGLLLQNQAYTSHFNTQLQKQELLRNSKDEKEKALYNPIVDMDIQQGIEELAKAPMTKDAYGKLEKRNSIPFYDLDADIRADHPELFTKDGGIKTVDVNGVQTVTHINGPKSYEAYLSLYNSYLSRPKYAAQNKLVGRVLVNETLKELAKTEPNLSYAQLKTKYAEESTQAVQDYYKNSMSSAREAAIAWKKKNAPYMSLDANGDYNGDKEHPPVIKDPAIQAKILENINRAKASEELAKKYESEFSENYGYNASTGTVDGDKVKKRTAMMASDPYNDATRIYNFQYADKWAKGMASLESIKLEETPGWKTVNDAAQQTWKNQFDVLKFQTYTDLKERGLDIQAAREYQKATGHLPEGFLDDTSFGGLTPLDGTGYGQQQGTGQQGGTTGLSSGAKGVPQVSLGSGNISRSGVDVSKVSLGDVHQTTQAKSLYNINSMGLSYDGFPQLLSSDYTKDGLDSKSLMLLTKDYQDALKTGKFNMSQDAIQRRQKVIDIFNSEGLDIYTKNGIKSNPIDIRNGLMALAQKKSTELFQSPDLEKQNLALQLSSDYDKMHEEVLNYERRDKEYKERLNEFLTGKNKETYKKILNDTKTDVATSNDLLKVASKYVDNIPLKDGTIITVKDLADAYATGQFDYSTSALTDYNLKSITVNNKKINLDNIDYDNYANQPFVKNANRTLNFKPKELLDHQVKNFVDRMSDRFGKSDDFQKMIINANSKVIGKMPEYSTGIVGSDISFDLTGTGPTEINPAQKVTALKIVNDVLIPANQGTMSMYTADGKPLDEGIKKDIMTGNFTDNTTNLVGKVTLHQFSPITGKPAVELKLQSGKGEKDIETIGKSTVGSIKKLGSIWIDIAPDAKGILSELPKADTYYTFGKLLKGESIESLPLQNKMGYTYHIIPIEGSQDATGRYTEVEVQTSHWDIDETTGQVKQLDNGQPSFTKPVKRRYSLLSGTRPLSPDELKQAVGKWSQDFLTKRAMILQNAKSNPLDTSEGGVSVLDLIK
jgi:hypothetical protein